MQINGSTPLYGLIGSPVAHSISPQLHNGYLKAANLSGIYLAFEVQPEKLSQAIAGFRAIGIGGLNVTSPHKERVIAYLDEIRGDAALLGSVNTIRWEEGRLIGFNTDTVGIKNLMTSHGFTVRGKKVAVLGSGGAAKSAVLALLQLDAAEVRVFSRTEEKRRHMLERFADQAVTGWDLTSFGDYAPEVDLLLNATPVGMGKMEDQIPVSIDDLKAGAMVVDLIYHPERTLLLKEAAASGHPVANGLHMLVGQAAAGMGIWTDTSVPLESYLAFI